MKNIQNKLMILLLLIFTFPNLGFSQDHLPDELRFEVNRIYPYISITKEELKEANSLADINRHYESSWIRTFISVEIETSHNGEIVKSVSKNDILSQEQKDKMSKSDAGVNISIKVAYIPENTLMFNDPKEFDFTFTIEPDSDAKHLGGEQQLMQYVKGKAIDKIPASSFEGYDLTAVKFTISEEGEIVNAHLFGTEYESSNKEKINKLLLETIRNMPCWKPAEYANGTKVKQEFVLTVGNMENCWIYLLNIHRNGLPKNG